MFRNILFLTVVALALAAPPKNYNVDEAAACDETKCLLPDCKCASTKPPTDLDLTQIPQFVFFTFDDAVEELLFSYYSEVFDNRTNPDGCPVSATFFTSHDYTDYNRVHDLYVRGHDIALHSITHQALTDYWKNITMDQLDHEFGDEKVIVSTFANIPAEDIKGMRLPFLQLAGDNTFLEAKALNLLYDCSWPTQTFRNPGLWPYTLDYKSIQDCEIGPCPTDSIPGLWVVPMIDWTDQQNIPCSMVDECVNIPDNAEDLTQWFIDNFNMQYKGNKAPFGFYVHAAYFMTNPLHFDAYKLFVDYLQGLNDVYLVNPTQAIHWIQNPVAIGSANWPACPTIQDLGCEETACELHKDEELRYVTVCGSCPEVYPWLGNPLGQLQVVALVLAAPPKDYNVDAAAPCDETKCLLPDCKCASTKPPTDLDLTQIPQFVFFTFDDAVEDRFFSYYSEVFDNRTNPDGCPVSATFFTSHDYTDYYRVHDLYVRGHDIALHSITHQAPTDYWKNITMDQLDHEFGDEKIIVSTFANIPAEDIKGMRLPFLQLAGDNTFLEAKALNLLYDCSWPTQTFRNPGLWPYTLDYQSIQDCPIGPCPTASIPGLWVVPMIDWTDQQNILCNMVDECVYIPDNAEDLMQWFVDNFNLQYKGNRAPVGVYLHAAYFITNPIHFDAYKLFVDYLQGLNDVYLVNPTQAIHWIQNPVAIGSANWPACPTIQDLGCEETACELHKDEELRYVKVCGNCPEVYPWLGNPLGQVQG